MKRIFFVGVCMDRCEEYRWVIPEDRHGAVAVMVVHIDDGHTRVPSLEQSTCDSRLVDKTKSPKGGARRMVPWVGDLGVST